MLINITRRIRGFSIAVGWSAFFIPSSPAFVHNEGVNGIMESTIFQSRRGRLLLLFKYPLKISI